MTPEEIRDRGALERFLRRDASAHVYGLADLDDAFFPDTRWFASRGAAGELDALCLVLEKLALPIVYAIAPPEHAPTLRLLRALTPRLPRRFFVNFPIGYEKVLGDTHEIAPLGEYVKMRLADGAELERHELAGIETLGPAHAAELEAFYGERAFGPSEHLGFFERYMLELFPWCALREDGRIVSVAGVHVFSRRYGVAALANVATAPSHRGRGLARAVCARLARELAARVPLVGLNVASANTAAQRCYEAIGFRAVLRYEEAVLTVRGESL